MRRISPGEARLSLDQLAQAGNKVDPKLMEEVGRERQLYSTGPASHALGPRGPGRAQARAHRSRPGRCFTSAGPPTARPGTATGRHAGVSVDLRNDE
jgi:hypothetical protein